MGPGILILNLLSFVFILAWLSHQWNELQKVQRASDFFTAKRFRHGIALSAIVGIPLLLINLVFPTAWELESRNFMETPGIEVLFATLLAFSISFVWSDYIRRIDYFQSEPKSYLAFVFILSCIITSVAVRPVYRFVNSLGFEHIPTDSTLYDFFYCVFVIGGIEELAKIIPVLVLIRFFPKIIDEPIDYIVYGSISALGFAFIENIDYIAASGLRNIGGRALYAAVAHMTFSSALCYTIMLRRTLSKKYGPYIILYGIAMAIGGHGFYDFWLIHWDGNYGFITTLFFLFTIQIWFRMKNNAMNLSPLYDKKRIAHNDDLRHFLISSLAGILMLGYIIAYMQAGKEGANQFLFYQFLVFGYVIFYLAFGLSRYQIFPNRLYSFKLPSYWLFPRPNDEDE